MIQRIELQHTPGSGSAFAGAFLFLHAVSTLRRQQVRFQIPRFPLD